MKLKEWLQDHFQVERFIRHEAKMTCPRCGGDKLYFNLNKRVGLCHRASCGWTPTLRDFSEYAILPSNFIDLADTKPPAPVEITLPDGLMSVLSYTALDDFDPQTYLMSRGITSDQIKQYNIQVDPKTDRIYVPIYHVNELVSYVSRSPDKKYLYPRGSRHMHTLLNYNYLDYALKYYDQPGLEQQLTTERLREKRTLFIVENTFVAIAFQKSVSDLTTTAFGSYLSKEQADLIAHSAAKKVIFMWDEGADVNAQKAVRRLGRLGVPAQFIRILGQPDDYPPAFIRELLDYTLEQDEECVDCTNMCQNKKVQILTPPHCRGL